MTGVLFSVGLVVAVAAAGRSTWSPCGLSMLSTITPFGEQGRGHRYRATAAWFIAGGLAGGACLGGIAAAGAEAVRAAGGAAAWTHGTGALAVSVAAVGAGLALVGALVDAGAFGPVLPVVRRQVDDGWLGRYRPWVYGFGFGWQIGVGLATYVMTAGVLLVLVLGILSGSPWSAWLLGAVFGLARGSTVLLSARAATPAELRRLHQRIDRFGPAIRAAVVGVQAGAAVGLGIAAALSASGVTPGPGGAAGAALGALAGGGVGWSIGGTSIRGWSVRGLSVAALALAGAVVLASCSSSGGTRVGAGRPQAVGATTPPAGSTPGAAPSTNQPARSATPTTVPGQLPTVYDCGGAAYEPSTLLVVCGVGTATATGIRWSSWTASTASGRGTVNLPGKPAEPAELSLGAVVQTGQGPQFSQLQARWTQASPDGHQVDMFKLATAAAA